LARHAGATNGSEIDQNESSVDPNAITAISATIGPTIAAMTISR